MARALFDADLMEAARFRPFYGTDENRFQAFLSGRYSRLSTEVARSPAIQKIWIDHRSKPKQQGNTFANEGARMRDGSTVGVMDIMRKIGENRHTAS